MENTENDERVVEFNCGIVPSELIADASDSDSDTDSDEEMDPEELRLIHLINNKVTLFDIHHLTVLEFIFFLFTTYVFVKVTF